MKVQYFPDTDTLYIEFKSGPAAETDEIAQDVLIDYSGDGQVMGVTIEHASARLDLHSVDLVGMPSDRIAVTAAR